jgi:uncharacterized cupredoxin-like copper-binding protein
MKDALWKWGWLLAAALLVIILAGCPPRQTAQGPEDDRMAGTEERTTEVSVSLTEFAIKMEPDSAPSEDVVFNVRNEGNAGHAFEIEGQGIEEETRVLQPGESETLRVENMRAGSYEVYCPVGNHEDRGMKTTFTVTGE